MFNTCTYLKGIMLTEADTHSQEEYMLHDPT